MKIKCDYCGSTYEDTLSQCPNCAAPNPSRKETNKGSSSPKTIEELKEWYVKHNLPSEETTRFFIGRDYRKPKAFGIYKKENGEFVVYKNKADGSRAVRYQGKDEAYAVNELYSKLKEEIFHQKNLNSASGSSSSKRRSNGSVKRWLIEVIIFYIIYSLILSLVRGVAHKHDGYYYYSNMPYYNDAGNWYVYVNDSWQDTVEPLQYDDDYSMDTDNYLGKYYPAIDDYDFTDIKDSDEWDFDHTSSSSDYDSDSNWSSSDSWDSGGMDWDSDW